MRFENLRRGVMSVWCWFASGTRAQQTRVLVALALLTVAAVVVYGRLPEVTVTCGVSGQPRVEVPIHAPTDSWRAAVTGSGAATAEEKASAVAACRNAQFDARFGRRGTFRGHGSRESGLVLLLFGGTAWVLVWLAGGRSRPKAASVDEALRETPAGTGNP